MTPRARNELPVTHAETDASRTERRRWIALVVLCVGVLMIILDSTVVNVALPSIQRDLHFSQSNLAWVINAYLITFGGLLLLAGRLGDLLGRKRVFLAGLTLFTSASLACGLSGDQAMLITARFIQGIGGALSSAVILGMVVTMFPEPHERARAIGVYSFVASAGASLGLLLGGVVTQLIDWHWIFFINIPIGVVTILLSLRIVERDGEVPGLGRDIDIVGAGLVTAAVMLAVYSIVEASGYGWGSLHTLGLLGLALVLLGGFVARESTAQAPLIPLRMFGVRNVSGANLVQLLMVSSLFGMFFLGVLFMQHVLGYTAIETGVAFLPVSLGIGVLSLGVSPRLNFLLGPKRTLLGGLLLVGLGLAWIARAPIASTYWIDLFPSMLLLGVGAGLAFPSLMTLSMSAATPEESGLASGLVNTTMQVGGALGLAVLATLSATRTNTLLAAHDSRVHALVGGYHLAWVVSAVIAFACVAVAQPWIRAVRLDAGAPIEEALETAEGDPFLTSDLDLSEAA